MADIAIKPAVSIDESGVVRMADYSRPNRLVPAFLVSLHADKKGVSEYFIATKFDDAYVHFGKFVGFYFEGTAEDIIARYEEIISTTPATNYVEILFPHHQIKSVRSLVYKHKAAKQ